MDLATKQCSFHPIHKKYLLPITRGKREEKSSEEDEGINRVLKSSPESRSCTDTILLECIIALLIQRGAESADKTALG